MKSFCKTFIILILSFILLSSCDGFLGKAAEDPNQGCLFFFNNFENQRDHTEMARNEYSTSPTKENCENLEKALAEYLLALTALTTVDYCLELRDDIGDETFAEFIISEAFTTQQALDEIDGKCE